MKPRLATADDVAEITRIYNDAILNTTASFWTEPRPEDEIRGQFEDAGERYPWVVVGEKDALSGVAWSKRWNARSGYDMTAEVSVYVDESSRGKGVGTILYTALVERLRSLGYANVIGGVALPNEASVRLHESAGFEQVACFKQVGIKFGEVMDVGYWQLRL